MTENYETSGETIAIPSRSLPDGRYKLPDGQGGVVPFIHTVDSLESGEVLEINIPDMDYRQALATGALYLSGTVGVQSGGRIYASRVKMGMTTYPAADTNHTAGTKS